jgi:hypothetical protein
MRTRVLFAAIATLVVLGIGTFALRRSPSPSAALKSQPLEAAEVDGARFLLHVTQDANGNHVVDLVARDATDQPVPLPKTGLEPVMHSDLERGRLKV